MKTIITTAVKKVMMINRDTEQRNAKSTADRKAAKTGITECKGIKIAPKHLKNGAPALNLRSFSSNLVRFGAHYRRNA